MSEVEETSVADLDDIYEKELSDYDSVFVAVPDVGYYTLGMSRTKRPDVILLTTDHLPNEITNGLQSDALEAWEANERMPVNRIVTSRYINVEDVPVRIRLRTITQADLSVIPHRGVPAQRTYIVIGLPDENNRVPGEFGFQASPSRPDIDVMKHLNCFDDGIEWDKYYPEDDE